ncbi:SDR family oxidoreductase [Streptomyces olivaceus]|uniref:SDR family oxidoreductase n=2 Tax=Streptomyces TaxID=1883 RepID=A0ABS7WCG1_STROV|nr:MULTISPECIES: SDR family oxidoreductase [Streptomyces]AOW85464.1 short-chain dehydrogenase [Streptomyces olivaceus]MBZ6084375.1 SDR family oxidoreductase [Streptomyces olivaceus]MBZ6092860.1 SDR family oxidoreductase [Streptomyces olivaceus]MBZ6099745.1 SDR family oxidoreductase [Streptomyces olivaceus]MBZ6105074.1 SDR family oxidoreductase [Streptomyces olivaceus]
MTDSPLQNRTVVVTGAARGLGAALARACARRGARVALLGREKPLLDALAARLPTPALAVEADVTDPAALDDAAGEVRRRLGTPSVVVANAGIAEGGPFATSDPQLWRRVVDVNLTGSAHTARAFLPDLLNTAGYHLQVASLASLGAAPMMSAYCASKAGVEAFVHSLRAEVAHHGIAVGIAYLNWIDTDMIRDADRHPVLRELRGHMPPPARRTFPPDEVAARLVRAVERRRTAVYVPGWLRLAQLGRTTLPPVVLRLSRHELPRLEAEGSLEPTGPLGAGGLADRQEGDAGAGA